MSERKDIPFTNEHFTAFCEKMVGQPYWYGTCVYKCTQSVLNSKASQYPSHYGSGRTSRYKDDIARKKVCSDCVGLIKGYMWSNGGEGVIESIGTDKTFTRKYGSNKCPDKSANGMFEYAKSKGCAWGTMDTLPEIPGLALRSDGHIGVYVGGGYAVEERGFNYGCVRTKVASRKWTHWCQLPFIDYGDEISSTPPMVTDVPLGSRLLKKDMTGSDVKELQEALLRLGYSLPKYGADGDFGSETEKALKAFQKAEGLTVDGKYGDKSHAALMDALADDEEDGGQPDEPGVPAQPDTPAAAGKVVIVSNGGKVNIRKGNGANYARITQVGPGTAFEHVATAANGWHAVVVNGQVGWVSGQYAVTEG